MPQPIEITQFIFGRPLSSSTRASRRTKDIVPSGWCSRLAQRVAVFAARALTFRTWPVPPELDNDGAQQSMVMPWRSDKRPQDCRYDQLEVTPAYELDRVFGARDSSPPFGAADQGS